MSVVESGAVAAAAVGLAVALVGCAWHVRWLLSLPFRFDVAEPKGSGAKGILYAYTLGMAPWEKESTRHHVLGYLRGVVFHVGIFAALAVLVVSLWFTGLERLDESEYIIGALHIILAAATALGGIAGLLGLAARYADENLRVLSTKDDYFSVALVSAFTLSASVALLAPGTMPVLHVVSAITLAYVPFGKVRHCIYFFFSRFAFGALFGHRGVIEKARS